MDDLAPYRIYREIYGLDEKTHMNSKAVPSLIKVFRPLNPSKG